MSTSKSRIARITTMRPEFRGEVKRLAEEFSKVLRIWLTPMQMAIVVERNSENTDERVCHSHDFCDANMAMQDAFERVFGREPRMDGGSDLDESLWGFAWDVAKDCEFDVDAIRRQ